MKHYKSVFENEQELLKALIDIHLEGMPIQCDPMYFKGNFYKDGIVKPFHRFDISPPEGIDCAIGFFENDSSAHVMVLVHLEDLGSYECWYNDDLTHYNLQDGKWITIEPQTTIEYQADEEWMQQWNIEMAVEIDYEKATS